MRHALQVRDKLACLCQLMEEFPGGRLSLEGDLSRCHFPEGVVFSREPTGVLRSHTIWPVPDFVVLRIEPDSAAPILKGITSAGLRRAIIHVQIERDGVLQFGAYDNFHHECVVTDDGVSLVLLGKMKAAGVLRGYRPIGVE